MENYEINTTTDGTVRKQSCGSKWLYSLLVVQIISITYGMVTRTVNFGIFNEWLKLAISVGVLFCLSKLVRSHGFYRLPVTFLTMKVVCTLARLIWSSDAVHPLIRDLLDENYIKALTIVPVWMGRILWICDTGARLFELIAHGKLAKTTNPRLGKYWRWLTVATIVVSTGIFILNVFVPDMLRLGTIDVEMYQKMVPFLNLPGILVRIAYLAFLFQTGKALENAQNS